MSKHFVPFSQVDASTLVFSIGVDRNLKPTIAMKTQQGTGLNVVTCPAVTMWPRCSGDGNFGTMWGPTDIQKAKYTLDLTDGTINDQPNADWGLMAERTDTTSFRDALPHLRND